MRGIFPPSTVDSSASDTTQERVQKFLRGEAAGLGSGVYDVEEGADPREALENMDVTRTEGFDLADGSRIARAAEEKLKGLSASKPGKASKEVKAEPDPKGTVSEPSPKDEGK